MNELLQKSFNTPTMSSREIAELCDKRHDNVMADIRTMCEQLNLDVLNFEHIYLDSMNRQQTEYLLDKDTCLCLVAGYNAKLRMAIIKRWQELEQANTPTDPLLMIELYHGDCLEILKQIPDGSVDMILADPPYGTTACKWDSIIPLEPMWEQLKRVIKPNGIIALFGSEPFSSKLRISNFEQYKYDWYWLKNNTTGFMHAKNKPMKNLELISVFSSGTTVHKSQSSNRMTYNPQGLVKVNKTVKSTKNRFGTIVGKRQSHKDKFTREYTNYPKMTLEFNCEHGLHPTQKPVALLEYLIKTYTNEGETVLDFTMGSGSTMIACLNTNRKGIGIELDKHYFDIATKRIKAAENELAKI